MKELVVAAVLLPFPLVLWWAGEELRTGWRRCLWYTGAAFLMGFGLLKAIVALIRNAQAPPLWDFYCYWIYGRTIAEGRNPYDPEALASTAVTLTTTPEFQNELLFFYSPPSLFLLAPLGWTDIRTACNIWQVLNLLSFGLCAWLLLRWSKTLPIPAGPLEIWFLYLTLRGTSEIFVFTQVSFLLLAALLVYWLNRDRMAGGAALAAGVLLKPFLAFAPLDALFAARRSAILGGMVATVVLCGSSWLVFGSDVWRSYLFSNPAITRAPDSLFNEPINQSLLATVLRITGYDIADRSPYAHPLFIVLAVAISLATGARFWRYRHTLPDWSFSLLICWGLLIFPKTLSHYSIFLIMPGLTLWGLRGQISNGRLLVTALISATWLCVWWQYAFLGFAILWFAFICLAPSQKSGLIAS